MNQISIKQTDEAWDGINKRKSKYKVEPEKGNIKK